MSYFYWTKLLSKSIKTSKRRSADSKQNLAAYCVNHIMPSDFSYLLPHRYTQIYLHLGVLGCYFTNAYFTPNYVTDSEKHSVPDILVELLP